MGFEFYKCLIVEGQININMSYQKKILRLNFNSFQQNWILHYAHMHLSENRSPDIWKNNLMYFLIDWFSNSPIITTYTSGSTGTPHKIDLLKKHMEISAQNTLSFFKLKSGDKVLLPLPVNYIAAKMLIVRSIVGNLNLYCIKPSSYPYTDFIPNLDFAVFTPAQFSKLLDDNNGKSFIATIKTVLLGGSSIPISLAEKIKNLKTEVWHSYGMTETMSHIALRKVNGSNSSKRFLPIDGVKLSVANNGCLIISAPNLGIANMLTNDMVEMDKTGSFTVLGRKDNVINSGGIKLFPEIIEKKIEPFLKNHFYITSEQDEYFGEIPVLFIQSKQWSNHNILKLMEKLKGVLDNYELPKKVYFNENFNLTESGKIIRKRDK